MIIVMMIMMMIKGMIMIIMMTTMMTRFKKWDENGDGKLSFEELKDAAAKDASKFLHGEDVNAIFIVGDKNMDGKMMMMMMFVLCSIMSSPKIRVLN